MLYRESLRLLLLISLEGILKKQILQLKPKNSDAMKKNNVVAAKRKNVAVAKRKNGAGVKKRSVVGAKKNVVAVGSEKKKNGAGASAQWAVLPAQEVEALSADLVDEEVAQVVAAPQVDSKKIRNAKAFLFLWCGR